MPKQDRFSDRCITAFLLTIGAAEAAHLCTLVLHGRFSFCALLTAVAVSVVWVGYAGLLALQARRKKTEKAGKAAALSGQEKLLLVILGCILSAQLAFIVSGDSVYRDVDMTVETVVSFLQTDALYQVNPMTGEAYAAGMPARLKILCLPTLYGAVCRLTGISPVLLIHRVVPCVVLVFAYLAFASLGQSLFPASRKKQLVFLVATALLFCAGNYASGVDGFALLSTGWRGVSIRNVVLIPYCFSLGMRRKYFRQLLCVCAEGCIVWTFYGLGMCLLVLAGLFACQLICGHDRPGKEACE